jgi:hypothetical protein
MQSSLGTNQATSCDVHLLDLGVAFGFIGDARSRSHKRTVAWWLYARAGRGGCVSAKPIFATTVRPHRRPG